MVILKLDLDQWDMLTIILVAWLCWRVKCTPPGRATNVEPLYREMERVG